MRFAVLGSGSSANSCIFEHGKDMYLFDNGFSCKELSRRAEISGFDLSRLTFIFLTHVHNDHLKGVASLSRKYGIPVVAHRDLPLQDYIKGEIDKRLDILQGRMYRQGGLSFEAFGTSHDAPFSLGYHFSLGGTSFTLMTDTGIATEEMRQCVLRSDVLFLEANYDETMLEEGSYPRFLKNRISSDIGHLSNSAAISFLNGFGPADRLKQVYFCHLSGNNNCPRILRKTIEKELRWQGRYRILQKGELFNNTEDTIEEEEPVPCI
jgi:phosphoribosyl 1,2-cyclic phosphodiesterase